MRRLIVLCLMLVAVVAHAAPADGKRPRGGAMVHYHLAPTTFSTEESPDCGATTAVCASTGSPGTAQDPVMTTRVSVVDPVDPAPAFGYALKWARHRQVVEHVVGQPTPLLEVVWTFRVDETMGHTATGTGPSGSTVQLTVTPQISVCANHSYGPQYVIRATADATLPAGTTYTATWKFAPCAGTASLPAGTVATFTAELYHSVHKDGLTWSGRADYAGALRTVSVTAKEAAA